MISGHRFVNKNAACLHIRFNYYVRSTLNIRADCRSIKSPGPWFARLIIAMVTETLCLETSASRIASNASRAHLLAPLRIRDQASEEQLPLAAAGGNHEAQLYAGRCRAGRDGFGARACRANVRAHEWVQSHAYPRRRRVDQRRPILHQSHISNQMN